MASVRLLNEVVFKVTCVGSASIDIYKSIGTAFAMEFDLIDA